MHACHAKNMNEALKQNSFIFFGIMLNCKLLLLLWPKITDQVQNQPRQWATCKDIHFGQFGEHSASLQYEVELPKLPLWPWWHGGGNLATWIWHNSTWQNSPPIFHSLGHGPRCPILHCYVIKSSTQTSLLFIQFCDADTLASILDNILPSLATHS